MAIFVVGNQLANYLFQAKLQVIPAQHLSQAQSPLMVQCMISEMKSISIGCSVQSGVRQLLITFTASPNCHGKLSGTAAGRFGVSIIMRSIYSQTAIFSFCGKEKEGSGHARLQGSVARNIRLPRISILRSVLIKYVTFGFQVDRSRGWTQTTGTLQFSFYALLFNCLVCPVNKIDIATYPNKAIKHSVKTINQYLDCTLLTNLTWLCP